MKANSSKLHDAKRDHRVVVLLFLGLLLGFVTLFRSHNISLSQPPDTTDTCYSYTWQTGGHLPDGLYRMPDTIPVRKLYQLNGLTPPLPAGNMVFHPPSISTLYLHDNAMPVASDIHPDAAPFFFLPIPLNFADKMLLATVPGIGPRLAERILAFRKDSGMLNSPDDLLLVNGIGQKRLKKIMPYFSFKNAPDN